METKHIVLILLICILSPVLGKKVITLALEVFSFLLNVVLQLGTTISSMIFV